MGSVLAGSREFVEEARNNRKRYGGAMRQAGIIAAGALYALEHNLDRLVEDHENAAVLAGYLRQVPGLEIVHPVQTNILIVAVGGLGVTAAHVVAALKEEGVLCGVAAIDRVRFVTHLDVSAEAVKAAGEIAARVFCRWPGRSALVAGIAASDSGRRPSEVGWTGNRRCSWCGSGSRTRTWSTTWWPPRPSWGRWPRRLGGDEERWRLAGLLHDLDVEETAETMEVHGTRTVEWLREAGFDDEEVLQAILAHNSANGSSIGCDMDRALFACDCLTGLVTAAALIRPEKKLAPGGAQESARNASRSPRSPKGRGGRTS